MHPLTSTHPHLPTLRQSIESQTHMDLLAHWHQPQDGFRTSLLKAAHLTLAGRTVLMRLDTPNLEDPVVCSSRSDVFEEALKSGITWNFETHTPLMPFGQWLQVSGKVQNVSPEEALQLMHQMDVDIRAVKTKNTLEVTLVLHHSGCVPLKTPLSLEEITALNNHCDLQGVERVLHESTLKVLRQRKFYAALEPHLQALPEWLSALIQPKGMK